MKKVKKEKRRKIKNRATAFVMAAVCTACALIIIGKSSVSANASETAEKYYTAITIEKGDTLSEIAEEYGMTVEEIREINNLDSNVLYAGENLIVTYSR